MRIAVIGAGGIGGHLAHRLTAAGAEVSVLARGAHLAAMQADGLTLVDVPAGTRETLRPALVTGDPAELPAADLAIFAVKGQDMAAAIAAARPLLDRGGHAVSFLNGVDGPEMLAEAIGAERALIGVARISATISAPGEVTKFTEFASYIIGDMEGRQDRAPVPAIRALMIRAGITAPEVTDARVELWRKFVSLTAFAALTAGARCTIGQARDCPETLELMKVLIAEAAAVGRARGVPLPEDVEAQSVVWQTGVDAGLRASLAHDLAAGKRLETDWLSGAVARLGAEAAVPTPAHRTVAALLAPWRDGPPGGTRD